MSAAVAIAWPHSVPPSRASLSDHGSRSTADGSPTCSTARSPSTQGATLLRRISLPVSTVIPMRDSMPGAPESGNLEPRPARRHAEASPAVATGRQDRSQTPIEWPMFSHDRREYAALEARGLLI